MKESEPGKALVKLGFPYIAKYNLTFLVIQVAVIMEHKITYAGQEIVFTLQRKKVKNINLKVRPDGTVNVSAHSRVPYDYIEKLVWNKAPWILKQINHFKQKQASVQRIKYETGDIVYFLGRPYPLRIINAKKKDMVCLNKDEIQLYITNREDPSMKEQLFYSWLKEEAKPVFADSLERIHALVIDFGIARPSLTVRTMKTRWGSCSRNKGKITLNTELIKMPKKCIDYVVLHELAHFLYRKHDSRFYNFLSSVMPDWQERKKTLEVK